MLVPQYPPQLACLCSSALLQVTHGSLQVSWNLQSSGMEAGAKGTRAPNMCVTHTYHTCVAAYGVAMCTIPMPPPCLSVSPGNPVKVWCSVAGQHTWLCTLTQQQYAHTCIYAYMYVCASRAYTISPHRYAHTTATDAMRGMCGRGSGAAARAEGVLLAAQHMDERCTHTH